MTFFEVCSLIGLPALSVAAITALIVFVRSEHKRNVVMRSAMQSLMLSQLIQSYNYWMPKGFAPIYARQNFESMYGNYKALDGDGFADDLHAKFVQLPIEKPKRKKEE